MVGVVHGTEDNEGFTLYHNGAEVEQARTKEATAYSTISEPLVTFGHGQGPEVGLDELLIWFRELSTDEVQALFNSYS